MLQKLKAPPPPRIMRQHLLLRPRPARKPPPIKPSATRRPIRPPSKPSTRRSIACSRNPFPSKAGKRRAVAEHLGAACSCHVLIHQASASAPARSAQQHTCLLRWLESIQARPSCRAQCTAERRSRYPGMGRLIGNVGGNANRSKPHQFAIKPCSNNAPATI